MNRRYLNYRSWCLKPLLTLLALCIGTAAIGQEQTVRLTHSAPSGSPLDRAMHEFASSVGERLGGKLIIKVFPAGTIAPPSETARLVQSGIVEMAMAPVTSLQLVTPAFKIFDLVFLFPDLKAVDRFQRGTEGRKLLNELQDAELKGLGYAHRGMLQIAAKTPILGPADLRGRKVRSTSSFIDAQLARLGAVPTPLAFAEVYQALAQGAVDATEATALGIKETRLNEVTSSLRALNLAYTGDVLIASLPFWDKLEPAAREAIEGSAEGVFNVYNKKRIEVEENTLQELHFTALQTRERLEWLDAAEPVWNPDLEEVGRSRVEQVRESELSESLSRPEVLLNVDLGGLLRGGILGGENSFLRDLSKWFEEGPYWNTWFEEFDKQVQEDQIRPNNPYTFNLDLSRYDLSELASVRSAATGETFREQIDKAIKDGKKGIHIWIRPVLLGAVPEGDAGQARKMSILLDRLQGPDDPIIAGQPGVSFGELAGAGRIGIVGELSDNRPYRLPLQTGQAGCGVIALSIPE
jgi:C4-dicarboxylate-binding protein DctP